MIYLEQDATLRTDSTELSSCSVGGDVIDGRFGEVFPVMPVDAGGCGEWWWKNNEREAVLNTFTCIYFWRHWVPSHWSCTDQVLHMPGPLMYSNSWFIPIHFIVVGFNNNGLEASDSLKNTQNYIILYPSIYGLRPLASTLLPQYGIAGPGPPWVGQYSNSEKEQ